MVRASSAPSSRSLVVPRETDLDQLNKRLTQVEEMFLLFKKEDFCNCRNDVDQIERNIQRLIEKQNSFENKINNQIDLNKFVEEQNLIKSEQKKQRKEISKFLSNNSKEFLNLKEIIDQQQKLIEQLKEQNIHIDNSNKIEFLEKEFNQFKNDYSTNIQRIIQNNLNIFKDEIKTFKEDFKTFINQQIHQIKEQTKELEDKIKDLEKKLNEIKIEPTKKENSLPYLEKIPPKDLFEINDWTKELY